MTERAWLEGIKAAEEKKPRLNPYDNGNGLTDAEVTNWYQGYDLANIILNDVCKKRFA